jgi:cytochrome b561
MILKNTSTQFGLISILFHWLMAILIITMLCLGIYMTRISVSPLQLKLFRWHKELGFLVLILALFRLTWRVTNITPVLQLPTWEKLSARTAHGLLYGFMIFLPITGWLLSSAAGIPVSFFDWFLLPNLIAPSEELRQVFTEIHEWLAYSLIGVLSLHILAALKHGFIDKDDILERMLWP